MFAVIRTGGKQYRVEAGTQLNVEKISGEVGDSVELSDVLLVADGEDIKVGTPVVDGAIVQGEILEQGRGPKIRVFKKQRRQGKQLTKGHRQSLTKILVKGIQS